MGRNILIALGIGGIILGLAVGFDYQLHKPIHYHAGFLVYINGQLQNYSASQFMATDVCTINPSTDPAQIQEEKAHLHDNVGDVVHVHQQGAVWGDLFKNIGVTFPPGDPVTGYINGKQIAGILAYPIKPYDSVMIVVGSSKEIDLSKYVTLEHIRQIESKSESCDG